MLKLLNKLQDLVSRLKIEKFPVLLNKQTNLI